MPDKPEFDKSDPKDFQQQDYQLNQIILEILPCLGLNFGNP